MQTRKQFFRKMIFYLKLINSKQRAEEIETDYYMWLEKKLPFQKTTVGSNCSCKVKS